jgi:general secretion pathway protein H
MRHTRHRDSGAAGFTIIELLVALSIMVLVASVAMPFLRGHATDRPRLDAVVQRFAAALRLSRATAILRQTEVVLVIDTDGREFSSAAMPPQTFDEDIAAQLKIAEPERLSPARGGIRFFADGSSTGGELALRLGNRQAKICINWLDGEARFGTGC